MAPAITPPHRRKQKKRAHQYLLFTSSISSSVSYSRLHVSWLASTSTCASLASSAKVSLATFSNFGRNVLTYSSNGSYISLVIGLSFFLLPLIKCFLPFALKSLSSFSFYCNKSFPLSEQIVSSFIAIELLQVYNKHIFKRLSSQESAVALDFVACQSKKASPKAANIHNRWLSCQRQRSLRFHE